MTTDSGKVEESIRHSISKNGFPDKIVRLPFKPVYDSCKKHGTSLTVVLQNLEAAGVLGKIKGDIIEFRSPDKPEPQSEQPADAAGFSGTKGIPDLGNLQGMAQQYLSQLSPEQLAEIRDKVDNMSEEEKKNILKMFSRQFDSGQS